jgi:2,4-dienoyl-CoA reductase-like NADH-dependent reductase (Old Yellow Enzyme family)
MSDAQPPPTDALFEPMTFLHGPAMKNRLMLAPLTNLQSHVDGTLSEDEHRWLTLRAKGGFGLTMTCAAHVQAVGQGFPGQLGIWSDDHLPGLTRLAAGIKAHDSLAVVQLHHAGMRSPKDIIGQAPVCPSDNAEFGAVALSEAAVETLRDDFIAGAVRARAAGFDGIEIHGAHGYILCQFLSGEINQRMDRWGGSLENRTRLIDEILIGVRQACGEDFNIGLRLSPERFGLKVAEIRDYAERVMASGLIDYLDMSLWDIAKAAEDPAFAGQSLMSIFTALPRHGVRLGVAGKIITPARAAQALLEGVDFILLGRAAILHHDWPNQVRDNPDFKPATLPVTRAHLAAEGLGPTFLDYMATWKGFVAPEPG